MTYWTQFVENLPALPKKEVRNETKSNSPIKQMAALSFIQWALFFAGWLAWSCDAIDFFAVSLSVSRLVKTLDRPTSKITQSITLTLLFRPLGAAVFGLLSDRYGRKWPMIFNLVIVAVLSLATGFVRTFSSFLAFGIGMGGIWGLAAATALENMPVGSRGLFSGILQQGYACGYLLAAVFNLSVVPKYDSWRVLFYIAAAFSLGSAFVRILLPESQYFLDRRAREKALGSTISSSRKTKIFVQEAWRALKLHWIRCIYAVLLMTGFNFFSHGSQDLYPTYLQSGKGLSAHSATVATIIGNCGAVVGGCLSGWASQRLGRRLTIIGCCLWTCVWLPLWLLPNTFGPLAAGAFFVQSGVQGAWGVIPVYLTEISPVAFRAVWPGVAYQLGNMVSSASAQIESTAGGHLTTSEGLPDYGKVSCILIGVVAAWIIGCVLFGSEAHSSHFERGRAAFEQDGGLDVLDEDSAVSGTLGAHPVSSDEKSEKGVTEALEDSSSAPRASTEKHPVRA